MLPRHVMTASNVRNGRTTYANLSQNRQLQVIRPKPPPLDTNYNLMSQNLPSPHTTSLTTSVTTTYKISSRRTAGGLNREVT